MKTDACLSSRPDELVAPVLPARDLLPVEVFERVVCPFCGQSFELCIDTTVPFQRFTTDCEVCCRPFEVAAECDAGEVITLETRGD